MEKINGNKSQFFEVIEINKTSAKLNTKHKESRHELPISEIKEDISTFQTLQTLKGNLANTTNNSEHIKSITQMKGLNSSKTTNYQNLPKMKQMI